jgi:hypothetical protein
MEKVAIEAKTSHAGGHHASAEIECSLRISTPAMQPTKGRVASNAASRAMPTLFEPAPASQIAGAATLVSMRKSMDRAEVRQELTNGAAVDSKNECSISTILIDSSAAMGRQWRAKPRASSFRLEKSAFVLGPKSNSLSKMDKHAALINSSTGIEKGKRASGEL